MKREDKEVIIKDLTNLIGKSSHFYLTDISDLNAEKTSILRRKCFEKDITLVVAKNTLLKIALEKSEKDYSEIYKVLKGATSIMLTDTANMPAKLIKDFRKTNPKPIIKAAFVEESIFIGDQIDALANLKSKEELIGDIILILQSPMKTVISQLQSGKNILAGIVKTLSEK